MPQVTGPEATAKAREANRWAHARRRAADPVKLGQAVRTVVAGAPRLSAEQIAQIRSLLPPVRALEAVEPDDHKPAA